MLNSPWVTVPDHLALNRPETLPIGEGHTIMNPNRKTVKCELCGSDAELLVVPDGFDDAPTSFAVTRTCSGPCKKRYWPMTAQEMHERTGLPLTGWS